MIKVLFFGAAADRAGTRQEEIEVKDGATLAPMRDTLAFAVNGEYARGEAVVSAGDEVAVLPPVSGG